VSRTYAEPVEVGVSDGRPARFVWRGRLYTVLGVLDHWVISREWWKQQNPDLDTPAEREFWRIEAAPGVSAEEPPGPSAGGPRRPSAEAAPGFSARAGTYELRHDLATGQWILARVWDLTG
jgi:hypothetical protein